MNFSKLVAFLFVTVLLTLRPAAGGPAGQPNPLFDRVALIGASVTAGYTRESAPDAPKAEQYRLSRYWDAALTAVHTPATNLADIYFFMSPAINGRGQIARAVRIQPTLVVGEDFLFWFCYGRLKTNEIRTERFEAGLKLLESIKCALVVGDIPDASGADPDLLGPEEIPTRDEMAAANLRLKQWAVGRTNVTILGLSGFMRDAMANRAITVHGHARPAGKTFELLQSDRLHPSLTGCSILSLAALDALVSSQPGLSTADVRWDPDEVLRLSQLPSATATNQSAASPISAGK